MKILVTGDRGYIGAVLVPMLLSKNYQVVGIDAGYFSNIPEKPNKHYARITKDIRHLNTKDLIGIDTIIHLAALSNDPLGQINPKLTDDINYKASMRIAKLAKKTGIKRFIFSSSCSVYGISKNSIVDEESKVSPQTAYALSKIRVEKGLKKLADEKFCICILRNATVYGYSPMFRNDLVVNNFVTCALALGMIKVMSDGTPWRPLIDIRDLSAIFILFSEANAKKINAEVVNIGFNRNNFQVRDILNEVKKQLPKCEIQYTGEHGKDTRSYRVNFNKFSSLFPNYKQKWTLNKSIKDLIKNLQAIKYTKADFIDEKFTRLSTLKKAIIEKKLDNNLYILPV